MGYNAGATAWLMKLAISKGGGDESAALRHFFRSILEAICLMYALSRAMLARKVAVSS